MGYGRSRKSLKTSVGATTDECVDRGELVPTERDTGLTKGTVLDNKGIEWVVKKRGSENEETKGDGPYRKRGLGGADQDNPTTFSVAPKLPFLALLKTWLDHKVFWM